MTAFNGNLALAAMRNIEMFASRIASRPDYKPEGKGIRLLSAACEHECDVCFMGCAIAEARLSWWESELAKICGSNIVGHA